MHNIARTNINIQYFVSCCNDIHYPDSPVIRLLLYTVFSVYASTAGMYLFNTFHLSLRSVDFHWAPSTTSHRIAGFNLTI